MSSIIDTKQDNGIEGAIYKYQTKIKVIVHSHNSKEAISISDDVASCNLSKTLKGPGQANLAVLPSKNYLNLIFPNDYINIYFDIGDGEGWTRTFFGLVDRIEESYTVAENGTPSTVYSISCTDFMKIFSKTEIYFNPHINQRRDLNGLPFGTLNIGGLALMTQGIPISGSPDSIITNTIILLLGFGSQFKMPASYPVSDAAINEAREARTRAALRVIQSRLSPAEYNVKKQEAITKGRTIVDRLYRSSDATQIYREIETTYGLDVDGLLSRDNDGSALASALADTILQRMMGTNNDLGAVGNTFLAIDRTTTSSEPTFLDYMDLFSFVERHAIDGYTATETIMSSMGTIISILSQFSNEIVNELYFDLRPSHAYDLAPASMYDGDDFQSIQTDNWDRGPDDVGGGNLADGTHSNNKNGIKYVPALIMREYPFSTISDLDADSVPVSVQARSPAASNTTNTNGQRNPSAQENAANSEGQKLGNIFLGAVFSDRPNLPGRHYISTPQMNVEELATNSPVKVGRRVLDVAVISEKDITTSKFGRSDEDHVNLTEIVSDSVLSTEARWFMQDLSPITTPIQIMRNGLRKRTLTTLFTRYDRASTQNTAVQGTVPTSNVPQGQLPAGNAPSAGGTVATNGGPAVTPEEAADSVLNGGTTASSSSQSSSQVLASAGGSTANPTTSRSVFAPPTTMIPTGTVIYPVDLLRNGRTGDPYKAIPGPTGNSFRYRDRANTEDIYFYSVAQGGKMCTTTITSTSNGRNTGTTSTVPLTQALVDAGHAVPAGAEIPPRIWAFHYGNDIGSRIHEGMGIYAAMDGEIVLIALGNMYDSYGNCIVIKHDINGQTLYTSYCHLQSFANGIDTATRTILRERNISPNNRKANRYIGISPQAGTGISGKSNGLLASIPVRAGTLIGTLGYTNGTDSRGKDTVFNNSAPHLHFEYVKAWPPKRDAVTPQLNGNIPLGSPLLEQWKTRGDIMAMDPGPLLQRSIHIRNYHP